MNTENLSEKIDSVISYVEFLNESKDMGQTTALLSMAIGVLCANESNTERGLENFLNICTDTARNVGLKQWKELHQ